MNLPEPWLIKSAIVVIVLALANVGLYVLAVRFTPSQPREEPSRDVQDPVTRRPGTAAGHDRARKSEAA